MLLAWTKAELSSQATLTRETQMLWTWSGPGPTTELSCQNVADPEPGGPYPSRTKREPTSPTRCGPLPAVATEPGWPSPSQTEMERTSTTADQDRSWTHD